MNSSPPPVRALLTALASNIGAKPFSFAQKARVMAPARATSNRYPTSSALKSANSSQIHRPISPFYWKQNIDDMTPEIYGYLIDRLLEAGARDAFLTPVIMKKGRPGIQLTVLTDPNKETELTELIFTENTTPSVSAACPFSATYSNAAQTPSKPLMDPSASKSPTLAANSASPPNTTTAPASHAKNRCRYSTFIKLSICHNELPLPRSLPSTRKRRHTLLFLVLPLLDISPHSP